MSKVVGDIAVAVHGDISHLEASLNRGSRKIKGFGDDVDGLQGRMRAAGAKMAASMAAMTAAGAVAFGGLLVHTMEVATEIENLSRIAGTNVEDFQKMAFAASQYGIEQDKLADILKDTNDKIGDFVQTGGGPLADFFENIAPKVGLTADEFARLSGPEALQAYVSALESAGLSQNELTFYMEALASDATALLPLLSDNAREMYRLGDAAADLGVVIDEDLVRKSANMHKVWGKLMEGMKGRFISFASTVLAGFDQIFAITEGAQMEKSRRQLEKLADEHMEISEQLQAEKDRANRSLFGGVDNAEIERLQQQLEIKRDELNAVNDDISERRRQQIELEQAQKRLEELQNEKLDSDALDVESVGSNSKRVQRAREEQAELTKIEAEGTQDRLSLMMQAGQDLASALGSGNEKALRAVKAFAAAEALINSYRAAAQTLADPALPFFAKFGAVAAVLAQGASMVSAIKGANSSGATTGAASATSSGAAATASAALPVQEVFLRAETGVLGLEQLVDMINEAADKGYQIRAVTA